ncbi:unnamed protein product [Hyaloperonospora brassicae]|uniref:Flavin-containing monooxygenase n=1 Tax=Hyaloperonospora brassicae TaxID=162125 RepID=A0AAV0US77_HYABA|nr:unnamed protein product [Hyaloperonospora brassicae]
MPVKLRVGIIGGGAAGLITAKCLREGGHKVTVFEKTGHVGGLWKYSATASSGVYKSLRTNLPTAIMQLKDFPFQKGLPSFPSHADVLQYLERYCKHYRVDDVMRLQSTVTSLSKAGRQWTIDVTSEMDGDYEETFDRVVICNGHFATPAMAVIKGMEHFKGVVSHSRSYRTPESYKGKRVVLIGRGPSGEDISLELVENGASEVIVVDPEYDPCAIIDSQDRRLRKPVIERIAEDGSVMFTDGSSIAAPDEIMHCTGYLYTAKQLVPSELLFPDAFVQSAAVDKELAHDLLACTTRGDAVAPLYKHVFAIEDPSAAFVGLTFHNLPFLCFQLQARWIARVFDGSVALPSKDDMYEDFYAYLRTLEKGARKLHELEARQRGYFTEMAALSDTVVGEEIYEMCDDAGFLRKEFPYSYRAAEFGQDSSTGKWVRRFKSSDSSPERVKEFSG